jgi:hypothetical protein
MLRQTKIPFRNRSQSGWWIFREVQQWVSRRQQKITDESRCQVWENTRLIRARNRDEAFRKAMRLGQAGCPSQTKDGEWRFAGISMLLPVYEEVEDGAEILWVDRGKMSVRGIKKLVKSKREFSVFDDNDEA